MIKGLVFHALDLLGLNALHRRWHRGRIRVLLYHNILPDRRAFRYAITPEEFDRHLVYLKRRYHLVGLDQHGEWLGYRPDRVNLHLTFDDGFHDNFGAAMPILKRHGVPATFFLIADCVARGTPPPFIVARMGEAAGDPVFRTIDAAEARAMMADGATIGCHSTRHDDQREIASGGDLADGEAAKVALERAIGAPVANFAFPWGFHRPGQDEAFARLFRRVFLTRHGFCDRDDPIVPRNEVAGFGHLKAVASGAIDLFGLGVGAVR